VAKDQATQVQIQDRIDKITAWLTDGYTRAQILKFSAQHWDLSERQTDEYLRRSKDEIDEVNKSAAEHNLALITRRLWQIVRDNIKIRPGVARLALMDIARVRGLDRIDINVHLDRPLQELSDEELKAEVAKFNGQ
jgi:hypothetical protein